VRRRGDQCDSRLGVPQPRDLGRHLVSGKLPALARLRALRDLDLELFREREVLGRDAEAARRDLLDPRVAVGAEALGILSALAAMRTPRLAATRRPPESSRAVPRPCGT